MTEAEVETLVLDAVRRYTGKDVAADARFDADLRLSAAAKGNLFASLAQAFAARGLSLPSHGFLQHDFLACPSPAAVRDAIREKAFGVKPSAAKPAEAAEPREPAAATTRQKPAAKSKPRSTPAASRPAAAKKTAAPKRGGAGKKRRR